MKYTKIIIAALALLPALSACKPTEKGYREAYDAARNKRELARQENMLPATGLRSDDGPQLRIIEGDTIYVDRQILRTADGRKPEKKWYLAVGVYKMDTNAKASVTALHEKGWKEAVSLKGQGGKWYSMAVGAGTLDSIRTESAIFMEKNRNYPYIGFPGRPVIISAQ